MQNSDHTADAPSPFDAGQELTAQDLARDPDPVPEDAPTVADAPVPELRIALVEGVMPGKWLDRWEERYPDLPHRESIVAEADQLALPMALPQIADSFPDGAERPERGQSEPERPVAEQTAPGEAPDGFHFVFAREGLGPKKVKSTRGWLTIPLYTESMVLVASTEHDAALTEVFPVAAIAGDELLDAALVGYESAIELAANQQGVAVVPQAVARAYGRKDTVVLPLTEETPEHHGLSAPEVPLSPEQLEWVLAEPRVYLCFKREWQSRETGQNHPILEEFIGVVRGRREDSSRQPLVAQEQREQAAVRQQERQRSQSEAAKKAHREKSAAKKPGARGGSGRAGASKGRSSGKPGGQGRPGGKSGGGKPGGKGKRR